MTKLLITSVNTDRRSTVAYYDVVSAQDAKFATLQRRLAARCVGKMYRDPQASDTPFVHPFNPETEPVAIGWLFERRTAYDTGQGTFLEELWVEVVADDRLAPSGMPLQALQNVDASQATMRTDDVVRNLSTWLAALDPAAALQKAAIWTYQPGDEDDCGFTFDARGVLLDDGNDWDETQCEIAHDMLQSYVRTLAYPEYTPVGFLFGTHPGDGSLLGWYPEELYWEDEGHDDSPEYYPVDSSAVYRRS